MLRTMILHQQRLTDETLPACVSEGRSQRIEQLILNPAVGKLSGVTPDSFASQSRHFQAHCVKSP